MGAAEYGGIVMAVGPAHGPAEGATPHLGPRPAELGPATMSSPTSSAAPHLPVLSEVGDLGTREGAGIFGQNGRPSESAVDPGPRAQARRRQVLTALRPSQLPVTQPGDAVECEANAIARASLAAGTVVPSGLDPATVRIHRGPTATAAARSVGASAYALGDDVVLGETREARSRALLAHELAHVAQHRRHPDAQPRVHRAPSHVTLVDVDDLKQTYTGIVDDSPALVHPSSDAGEVLVDDHDAHRTLKLPAWQVARSPRNVDGNLASVKPNGDFWTYEIHSLTFHYRDGSTRTIPWGEIQFASSPPAAREYELVGGVYYPLLDGHRTYDRTNTPTILLGTMMVLEYVRRAQRDRRVAAYTVMSFQFALAQLASAANPGDWVSGAAPRPSIRSLRSAEPAIDPLDAELECSFEDTFAEPATDLPSAGPIAVAPEIAAGFKNSELGPLRRLLGKPIDGLGPLGSVWRRVANPGEAATLTAENSRRLFNNQRGRFWRAVRQDLAARAMVEDAGFRFEGEPTTAPVKQLADGTTMQMTIDHIIERQAAPGRALDPTNLSGVTRLENTVMLRQLTQQDPFQ